ncbi:MAG: 5'-methylthioadenosine/S-adenosylhomocysteine nucleosidase [Clostridia bacterium]|nr:5'-methylthioadenosine/S-adenosylhomocysteine nucleosidase [Clostridia bacterium]
MIDLKIGIIVADEDEYKPFAAAVREGKYAEYSFLGRKGHKFSVKTEKGEAEVISLLCGIGKVNATAATAHLVDIGCNVILNYGLSGGINGVRRGDICLCDRFLEHDFDLTGIGYRLCEKPGQEYIYKANGELIKLFLETVCDARVGTAVSGDCFVCDETLRNTLKNEFGAMSCDMETAAIAYVCSFSEVPFLALRRISDDAGADASDSYREMNTSNEILLSDYVLTFIQRIIDSGFVGKSYEQC